MSLKAAIGESDFRALRASGAHYVDKTGFIRRVLESGAKVLLLVRPRRFGKTLNLSTLRWFLEDNGEPLGTAFDGLEIAGYAAARQHFQRYPVISLTLKDVKASTYELLEQLLLRTIAAEVGRHPELASSPALPPWDRAQFMALASRRGEVADYQGALRSLSSWLHAHHGTPAIVLIDEYDAPVHAGAVHGFADSVLEFLRNFLSAGLKDNPHVHQGVLTGIMRIAKESLFSGLNNLAVFGPTRPEFATDFGFTAIEVETMLERAGRPDLIGPVAAWYDGYAFSGERIYNPWSIMSLLQSGDRELRPYWLATGSDDLLRWALLERGFGLRDEMAALLDGATIEVVIDEDVSLRDLARNSGAVWSFLLYSGYLTADALTYRPDGKLSGALRIPNLEVRSAYLSLFSSWLESTLGNDESADELVRAMLLGDAELFGRRLSELVVRMLSFHVTGGREAERVYHAFLLGVLARLEGKFEVRSERETGMGRADILVLPKRPGEPGVALELKRLRPGEAVEHALDAAVEQLHARDYAAELRARGVEPVSSFAIVFDGKAAHVRPG